MLNSRSFEKAPLAVAAIDTNADGRPDMLFVGYDHNRDGIPDVLQTANPSTAGAHVGYASVKTTTATTRPGLPSASAPSSPTKLGFPTSPLSNSSLNIEVGGVSSPVTSPLRIDVNSSPLVPGPKRSAGRNLTASLGAVQLGSPSSTVALEESRAYEASLTRRIHNISEQWRNRLEDAKGQLEEQELTVEKTVWSSKMRIFDLEEELKSVLMQVNVGQTRVETLERHLMESQSREKKHIAQAAVLENEIVSLRVALERRQLQTSVVVNERIVEDGTRLQSSPITDEQRYEAVLARAASLETEFQEDRQKYNQGTQTAALLLRVAELEQELNEERARNKQTNGLLYSQIADLQREVAEARIMKEQQARQCADLRSSLAHVSQEATVLRAQGDYRGDIGGHDEVEAPAQLRRRIETLEQDLAEMNFTKDQHVEQVSKQSTKISQLEQELLRSGERVAAIQLELADARRRDME